MNRLLATTTLAQVADGAGDCGLSQLVVETPGLVWDWPDRCRIP